MRRAVHELCERNILIKRQGSGTYVMSPRENFEFFKDRINWLVPDDPRAGIRLGNLVRVERLEAPLRVAERLGLPAGSEVFHIRRLYKYERETTVSTFDDVYLPAGLFPGLTEEMLRKTSDAVRSLYPFYESHYGLAVAYMEDEGRAVLLNHKQAVFADVPMPYPAISVERRSYTLDGRIVELRIMVSVTDRQKMVQRFGTDPRDLKETKD